MKTVALVPMKGNSVRVPGKNLRELGGAPLLWHILDTLRDVAEIDEIVVNTDSESIATAAREFATIRERKDELCGDDVSMNAIIADDLAHTEGDVFVQTHATNPLLSAKTIGEALVMFGGLRDFDSMFSVDAIHQRLYSDSLKPLNHDPERLLPTQDLEPIYAENSCLYIFTKESFSVTGARIGKRPMMLETPPAESIDIDTEEDWELARLIME